jgi:hypothetical protein
MNKVLTAEEILQQFKPDTRTAITQDFAWGKEKVLAAMEAYKNQSESNVSSQEPDATEQDSERVFYQVKDLMMSAMDKNLSPYECFSILSALGYKFSRASKEIGEPLVQNKSNQ